MNKLLSLLLVIALVFSGGCSLFAQVENFASDKPKKEEVKQAATDIKGMLREGPGKYAGDKYDEEKVKAELDKLPKNVKADQVYNLLVALLAEDYKPDVKLLDSVDPTIKTNLKTPDEVNASKGEARNR